MRVLAGAAFLSALCLTMGAHGYEVRKGGVAVQDPWTNATLRLAAGNAVYLTVRNTGAAPLKLTGASSPKGSATLHESIAGADGVVRMMRLLSLEIAPGETAAFKPEGMHIMLTGLAVGLRENETVPLTLMFENADAVTVEVMVESTRATKARNRPNP